MTLYKKATSKAKATISNQVYICRACGHTEIANKRASKEKDCPKCEGTMELNASKE